MKPVSFSPLPLPPSSSFLRPPPSSSLPLSLSLLLALFSPTPDIEKYVTVDAYATEEEDELSFPKGVMVDVLQKSLDGWWLIRYNSKTGLAPATFLRRVESGDSIPVRNFTDHLGAIEGTWSIKQCMQDALLAG